MAGLPNCGIPRPARRSLPPTKSRKAAPPCRLHLEPTYGTTFVVFREPAATQSRQVPEPKDAEISELDSALNHDWTVTFQPNRGAPESASFDRLISWSNHVSVGIKYFSGTATYAKSIQVPASALAAGAHQWLDLGDVRDLAEVTVNGKDLGNIVEKACHSESISRARSRQETTRLLFRLQICGSTA